MTYAKIMVHLEWAGEVDTRMKFAAGLANRFQSEMIGISAWMPRPRPILDPDLPDRTYEELKATAEAFKRKFEHRMNVEGRNIECRTFLEFPTECIAREMRGADLLVMERKFGSADPHRVPDTAAVVLKAGRPVLVAPPSIRSLMGRQIIVAWKDTREARRAVRDALPFLCKADRVVVTEVCEFESEVAASQHRLRDVVQYLSSHGISGAISRPRPAEGNAVTSLLNLAQDSSADLIVAGAYGHSRLDEWIFGGMTQGLLESSPVCLLLSH